MQSDAVLLSEALFTMLLMGGRWYWIQHRARAAGVAFGLATLTRPTTLPMLIVLPIVGLVPAFRRRGLARLGIYGILVIAPWTIRNAVVLHQFVPVATGGSGVTLLLGTVWVRPFSGDNPWLTYWADPDFRAIIARQRDESDAETRMREVAIQRIRAHPLRWMAERAVQDPKFFSTAASSRLVKIVWAAADLILLGSACYGVYRSRQDWQAHLPLLLVLGVLLVTHFPLMSERRYGAPLLPLFAIYAAIGVGHRGGRGTRVSRPQPRTPG